MGESANGRRPPWGVLLLIAVAIVTLVAVLTAVAASTSSVVGTPASFVRATPSPPDPITDIRQILEARDPYSLVGRRVELAEAALVEEVLSEAAIWAGQDDGRVLVVMADAADGPSVLEEGQRVIFTGRVERLSSVKDAQEHWDLREATLSELAFTDVYVEAERIDDSDGG